MKQIALGMVIAGVLSTPAWAQDAASAEKPVTVVVKADIPTDYYFRGIANETKGFIFQPGVDIGVKASDSVKVNFGVWNSWHSGESTKTFYETDAYASVGFSAGKFSPSVLYTAYLSPNDSFGSVHEVAFIVGYDSPIAPSVTLATELKNSGAGESGHTYLELAARPSIPNSSKISLAVPMALGLSLKDYYADTFGYFKAGLAGGTDLGHGVEVHAGLDLYFLGDALQFDDKTVKPVFSIGFSYTY
jgi:hypothetical protein